MKDETNPKRALIGRALSLAAAIATLVAAGSLAQPAGGDGRPPKPPLEVALDANGDGTIDASEIAKAPAALKKLDKNGDGKLTPDEFRRPRPHQGAAPQQGKSEEKNPR